MAAQKCKKKSWQNFFCIFECHVDVVVVVDDDNDDDDDDDEEDDDDDNE